MALPVLIRVPFVHLSAFFQSQGLLVIRCIDEGMDSRKNVLLGGVLEPEARPRDVGNSHPVLYAGINQLDAKNLVRRWEGVFEILNPASIYRQR